MNPKDIEKMTNQELADEIARASGIGAPTPDQTMRYGDLNTELVIRLTTDDDAEPVTTTGSAYVAVSK
jgi:hypothetical protein